jgi:phosphohistidine phosphatase SixA
MEKPELVSDTGRDFDRKLVERGKRNCTDMARYIKGHLTIPDIVLVSAGRREPLKQPNG